MTLGVDFTKDRPGDHPETLATATTVHETVRKAIACCDGEDRIVLDLSSAKMLIREWDVRTK